LLVTVHRTFLHIALAFLLLLSQQLGISHAITHLSAGPNSGSLQKKQVPVEKQCEQCLAFAALDAGPTSSSSAVMRPAGPVAVQGAAPFTRPLSAAILAFEPRAPPFPA
jgi:hypothetical protein